MSDLYSALMKLRALQAGDLIISRTGGVASVIASEPLVEAKEHGDRVLLSVEGQQKRVSLLELKKLLMAEKAAVCSFSAMRVAARANKGKSYNSATRKKLSSLISAMVRKERG